MKKIFKWLLIVIFAIFSGISIFSLFQDREGATLKIQETIKSDPYSDLNQAYLNAIGDGDMDFLIANTDSDSDYINVDDLLSVQMVNLVRSLDINTFTPYELKSNFSSLEGNRTQLISEYSSNGSTPYVVLSIFFSEVDSVRKVVGLNFFPKQNSIIDTRSIIDQSDNPLMIYIIFGLSIFSLIFAIWALVRDSKISFWWLLFILFGNIFLLGAKTANSFTLIFKLGTFTPPPGSQFYFLFPLGIVAYLVVFFGSKNKYRK